MIPRIMNEIEKQYLTPDAQGVIYRALLEERISREVAEMVIMEAVNVGQLKNLKVSADLMQDLMDLIKAENDGGTGPLLFDRDSESGRSVC